MKCCLTNLSAQRPALANINITLGTAGHIDHGKTSIVRCLTGCWCDKLPEEQARGMTIDLGFAVWERPDGRRVGIVDVPGARALYSQHGGWRKRHRCRDAGCGGG